MSCIILQAMPKIQHQVETPYPSEAMYALVNDINAYQQFVPGCTESLIFRQDQEAMEAKLTFSGGGFSKSFKTRNHLKYPEYIEMHLIEGPFKHLTGFWHFIPHPQGGSVIKVDLDFEFSSRFLEKMLNPVLNLVAHRLIEAFIQRAKACYGSAAQ